MGVLPLSFSRIARYLILSKGKSLKVAAFYMRINFPHLLSRIVHGTQRRYSNGSFDCRWKRP